jgi:hypothetical protein
LIPYLVDGSYQQSLLLFGNFRDEFRVVYYFSEPAKYATFMIVPYFISLIFYSFTKQSKYKYFSYIILFIITLTFSFAVLFSLLFVYLLSHIINIQSKLQRYLIYIVFFTTVSIALYMVYFYFSTNYFNFGGAFNKLSSFRERIEAFTVGFDLVETYPYGIGLLSWNQYDIPRGFGVIIVDNFVRGGYFYIFLYISLSIILIKSIIIAMKNKINVISKYYGMMVLTIFMSIQIYGPLEQRVFLVSLVLYTHSLVKYNKGIFLENTTNYIKS